MHSWGSAKDKIWSIVQLHLNPHGSDIFIIAKVTFCHVQEME